MDRRPASRSWNDVVSMAANDERMDPRREAAYAIVREDDYASEAPTLEHHITVKCVVWTLERAKAEVDRLNALNAEKGCRYFWQYTRVDRRESE
jgi:hypothetical protein